MLIGRLVRDPDLKFTAGKGTALCKITIAVDRRFSKEKESDFINCTVWGKIAESLASHMQKGCLISVSGALHVSSFEDKEGKKVWRTDVNVEEVQFLTWPGDKKDNVGTSSSVKNQFDLTQYGDEDITPMDDGEIPF
jgi:single-strand DNA-binding protein